jgi:hypothetical protein
MAASQKPLTCAAAPFRVFVACCLIGQTDRPCDSDTPNKFYEDMYFESCSGGSRFQSEQEHGWSVIITTCPPTRIPMWYLKLLHA